LSACCDLVFASLWQKGLRVASLGRNQHHMDAPAVVGQSSHDCPWLLETKDAWLGGDPFDSDSHHRLGRSHPCLHRVSVPLPSTQSCTSCYSRSASKHVSLIGVRATRRKSACVRWRLRPHRPQRCSAHRTILTNVNGPRPRAFSPTHRAREDTRLAADPPSSSLALVRSR
jgi:hypothetical protein